tara:strand:- start:170 stop:556 length:387 start_codon:yes stop_codon:yes gene_type:complete
MKIILPVKERKSYFNGWETEKATYEFECPQCSAKKKIEFKEILDAAWGWHERTKEPKRSLLAKTFGIDLTDRSIRNGMHAVVTTSCSECGIDIYTFFWFQEYRHSCYDISVRALATNRAEPVASGQRR